MAHTAHKTSVQMEELQDDPATFKRNVQAVIKLIQASKKTVFYTGAGISTSAGIPDYRGPQGVWTLQAEGKRRTAPTTDMIKAMPTPTHMAIVALLRNGLAHHVISQNVDGLHRKSGVQPDQISELHGNSNVEVCAKCRRSYLRDYQVSGRTARDHTTGNLCEMPGCGGVLKDNIINFGENLSRDVINRAFKESQESTLHICLGSSLTVRPACELPKTTKECGGKVVIVNLQRTPLDKLADVRVHSPVDEFMTAVMAGLGRPVPPFELERRIVLWREDGSVKVSGVAEDGMPASLLQKIEVMPGNHVTTGYTLPLSCPCTGTDATQSVTCTFMGHYAEPQTTLTLSQGVSKAAYLLTLDPMRDKHWRVAPREDITPPDFSVQRAADTEISVTPEVRIPQVSDFTGWHAVTPLDDCPHTHEIPGFKADQVIDLTSACSECGNVGENMICLVCGCTACGRHVKQHMMAHHDTTGHAMVCGFVDISFWCYKCDAYINPQNPRIKQYYNAIHLGKFGTLPFA